MKRTLFFISDHTGITVEAMGRALLSQFQEVELEVVHWPFLDSLEKAEQAVRRINEIADASGTKPLIFSSLVDPKLRDCIHNSGALVCDFFDAFTNRLAQEFQVHPIPVTGYSHGIANQQEYSHRIQAVNYALANDDGAVTRNYPDADLILLGVSRSGKTPTCLFLGLQKGIWAANYPLTEDDLGNEALPLPVRAHRNKLCGLTINAEQLQRIRRQRRPEGRYASPELCRREVQQAEQLFHLHKIPFLDTTSLSVEEIATRLVQQAKLKSRIG